MSGARLAMRLFATPAKSIPIIKHSEENLKLLKDIVDKFKKNHEIFLASMKSVEDTFQQVGVIPDNASLTETEDRYTTNTFNHSLLKYYNSKYNRTIEILTKIIDGEPVSMKDLNHLLNIPLLLKSECVKHYQCIKHYSNIVVEDHDCDMPDFKFKPEENIPWPPYCSLTPSTHE